MPERELESFTTHQCYALAPLLYEQHEHCHVALFTWPYTVCDEWVVDTVHAY